MATSARQESSRGRGRFAFGVAAAAAAAAAAAGIYAGISGDSSTAAAAGEAEQPPALVEPIGKTGHSRVIFTAASVERIGVRTARVESSFVRGHRRTVMPYTAVLYEANGDTFTYTSPKPRTFVRRGVRVAYIKSGRAFLQAGPPAGTAVVTVGAAEIWGVEYGAIEEAPEASGD